MGGHKSHKKTSQQERRIKGLTDAADPRFFSPEREGPPPMPPVEEIMKPSDKALHVRKQKYLVFSYMAPASAEGTPPEEERHVPQASDWVWFKAHGAFHSETQAKEFAQHIIAKVPWFDVHVMPMYQWVDIPPRKEASYEYSQDALKEQMSKVRTEREEETAHFDERIGKAIDKSARDMEIMRQVQREENERLRRGGEAYTKEEVDLSYLEKAGIDPEKLTLQNDSGVDLERMLRESIDPRPAPVTDEGGYRYGAEMVGGVSPGDVLPLAAATSSAGGGGATSSAGGGGATSSAAAAAPTELGVTVTLPVEDGSDDVIHVTPQLDANGERVYHYDMPLREGPPMTSEEFLKLYGIAPDDV